MSDDKKKPDKRKDAARFDKPTESVGADPADSVPDPEDTIEIASPRGAMSATFVPENPRSGQSTKPSESDDNPADTRPGASEDRKRNVSEYNVSEYKASEYKASDQVSVKRLSTEQVQSIADRFSAEREVASESEREQLLKTLGNEGEAPGGARSESSTEKNRQSPSTAKPAPGGPLKPIAKGSAKGSAKAPAPAITPSGGRSTQLTPAARGGTPVRGVAYFSGRTIRLGAAEKMTSGEELTLGGNRYQLRPGKTSSNVFGYIVSGALIVVAALIGKYYLADGQERGGEIVGVALNQSGEPYQDGAVVRLPGLGVSTVTNPDGLFRFSDIPHGTYKLEYNLAGSLGGSQIVSVLDDEASMVTLDGPTKRLTQSITRTPQQRSAPKKTTNRGSTSSSKASQKSAGARGALAVTSDVSGAVVFIDNQKLGQVNRTFRRMRTGKRRLRIEKDGYETYVAGITIKPNKITKVNATLAPYEVEEKPAATRELSASESFEKGKEAFDRGDNDNALESFNQALAKEPGMADAYFFRAEALAKSGAAQDSYLDYIRAGEIWSRQKRTQDALSAFDNAVEVSAGAAVAYKVRGDFYVNTKNREKGIKDYRRAIHADKKYYDAHLGLGIALFESGSYRKADKELRRARDFNDNDPTLYHYLMLNSLAKNDLGDLSSYYKQFKKRATPAQMARFRSDNKLAAVRRIVKD